MFYTRDWFDAQAGDFEIEDPVHTLSDGLRLELMRRFIAAGYDPARVSGVHPIGVNTEKGTMRFFYFTHPKQYDLVSNTRVGEWIVDVV